MSRTKRNEWLWIIVVSCSALQPHPASPQEPAATTAGNDEQPAVEEPLYPRGRYRDRSTNVSSRYYIWVDSRRVWHVRTASRQGRVQRFHGTIGVRNGEIDRVTAVGLETTGDQADTLNPDAGGLISFSIYTGGSFDGFDFTVDGDVDARVVFDLYQTKREAKYPTRIFIGSRGQNPPDVRFSLRADGRPDEIDEPEAVAEPEADATEEAPAEEAPPPSE